MTWTNRNQQGVALPLALFALVMITGLLVVFVSMSGMEPLIAANLGEVTQARYVADAGVEWAYDRLRTNANWSVLLAAGAPAGTMVSNQAVIPGSPQFGTYSVAVRNDIQAGDLALTGQPALDPSGSGTVDQNGIVILTATGTYGAGANQTQRQIQVVVKRVQLPPFPGALNIPGIMAQVDPGGSAHLHINGVDYNRDGSLGKGPLKFAMTVGYDKDNKSYENPVEQSLTRHHKNEMTGRDQRKPCCVEIGRGSDDDCPCEGEYSIVDQSALPAGEQLTSQTLAKFLAQIKASSSVTILEPLNGNGGIVVNNGKTTGANKGLAVNLGTVTAPTITYIKGSPDKDNKDRILRLKGSNSGAGILIVEDGQVEISDTFRWDGVVIVTGQHVGVTWKKYSRSFVYGAMVVNETSKDSSVKQFYIESNDHGDSKKDQFTTFYSSQQNLDMVQNGMAALVRLAIWREI